ncbi:MAG: hypothetical protein PUF62_05275 [Bacteroidales bacterium]|nr:hypothetical protein [Bacteroidales bacterium]
MFATQTDVLVTRVASFTSRESTLIQSLGRCARLALKAKPGACPYMEVAKDGPMSGTKEWDDYKDQYGNLKRTFIN